MDGPPENGPTYQRDEQPLDLFAPENQRNIPNEYIPSFRYTVLGK
jgi:hypothetical protein